jgi:formylglycine-generating enzyme required for sulfatase activity
MGNDNARPDERPAHRLTLPAFRAALRPTTNAEYAAFAEATGREPAAFILDARFAELEQPVVGVSWFDAIAYCDWLKIETGLSVRLPTEEEREYASLGGLEQVDWPWGNEPPSTRAELKEISSLNQPHIPSESCANGYGLICMADNVHEWCSNWYTSDYNGTAATGQRRASRGGSWRHQIKFNRISSRSSLNPSFRYNDYGFRIYTDVPVTVD